MTTLSMSETKTVSFLKNYANTNYLVFANFYQSTNQDDNPIPRPNNTSSFILYGTECGAGVYSNTNVVWHAVGSAI